VSIREQARGKVARVDRAIEEYRAVVEKLVDDIMKTAGATVDQLVALKVQLGQDIEGGLEEVEKSLAEAEPRLRSKYGPVFRALVEKPAAFQLFSFSVPTCTLSVQSLQLKYDLSIPKELYPGHREKLRITPAVPKVSQEAKSTVEIKKKLGLSTAELLRTFNTRFPPCSKK